ncbi:hypothetical protein FACS1894187_16600 [Synergistales bacterium]|nr:hypothetical protein FACS1894187_16600 [Synergistales bacterium]
MSKTDFIECPICFSQAKIVSRDQTGYIESCTYDIIHCDKCDTSFVIPLEPNDDLYNFIYQNGEIISGYDRYYRYANKIKDEKNPIRWLTRQEEGYLGVFNTLKSISKNKNKKDLHMLEIGSGYGYLTYALNCAGYNILGVDISQTVVDYAIAQFGNNYQQMDIIEFSKSASEMYDVIIFMEVIEHIPNVMEFMSAVRKLLKKNGSMIISTPNKSAFPKETLWHTDWFPLHLWWFSEESIRRIGKTLNMNVNFYDMSKCFNASYALWKNQDYLTNLATPPYKFTLGGEKLSLQKQSEPEPLRPNTRSLLRRIISKIFEKLDTIQMMAGIMRLIRCKIQGYKRSSKPCCMMAILSKNFE